MLYGMRADTFDLSGTEVNFYHNNNVGQDAGRKPEEFKRAMSVQQEATYNPQARGQAPNMSVTGKSQSVDTGQLQSVNTGKPQNADCAPRRREQFAASSTSGGSMRSAQSTTPLPQYSTANGGHPPTITSPPEAGNSLPSASQDSTSVTAQQEADAVVQPESQDFANSLAIFNNPTNQSDLVAKPCDTDVSQSYDTNIACDNGMEESCAAVGSCDANCAQSLTNTARPQPLARLDDSAGTESNPPPSEPSSHLQGVDQPCVSVTSCDTDASQSEQRLTQIPSINNTPETPIVIKRLFSFEDDRTTFL
jgi:hypothetical protein